MSVLGGPIKASKDERDNRIQSSPGGASAKQNLERLLRKHRTLPGTSNQLLDSGDGGSKVTVDGCVEA